MPNSRELGLPSFRNGDLLRSPIYTLGTTTDFRAKLPILRTPRQGVRSDTAGKIRDEARQIGLMDEYDNGVTAGFTFVPSAHTKSLIPISEINKNLSRIRRESSHPETREDMQPTDTLPGINPTLTSVAAHGSIWWWGPDGTRCDVICLSAMDDADRGTYLHAIADQFQKGIRLFMNSLYLEPDTAHQRLELYGLFGHSTAEERRKGFSRGAQSNMHGHATIADYPYREITDTWVQEEDVTYDAVIKQIAPYDSVVFSLLKADVNQILTRITAERLTDGNHATITSELDHSTRTDRKKTPLYEGYRITFDNEIPMADAYHILLDVVDHFENYYQLTLHHYEQFHKSAGYLDRQQAEVIRFLEVSRDAGLTLYTAEQFAGFVFNLKPTRGQLVRWIEELKQEKNADNEITVLFLNRQRQKYEKADALLKTERGAARAKLLLQQTYRHLTPFEANCLFALSRDLYRNPLEIEEIKRTAPMHLSGTYLFDKWRIDSSNRMWINSMTLATRLWTDKGLVEDLLGCGLDRQTNI